MEGFIQHDFVLIVEVLVVVFAVFFLIAYRKNRRLKKDLSRYLLIEERKPVVWLDYSFQSLTLQLMGALDNLAGDPPSVMIGEEVYDVYDWVHKEDVSIRSSIRDFLDGGEKHFSTELRIKNSNGSYGWYSVKGTLVRDKDEFKKRFVVVLENIDKEMSQEKNLLQKAENDLLTGVLNKKTMEERIRLSLENLHPNEHYIFYMIDLDNFKKVNDTLGHIYGDKVITDTAARLKELFPVNTMIGRLGGDEFAVCTCFEAFDDASLQNFMKQKAELIKEKLQATYIYDNLSVDVTASIGIASAPEFGTDFESIYQKADKALYLSKRSGKNRYSIYENSSAGME